MSVLAQLQAIEGAIGASEDVLRSLAAAAMEGKLDADRFAATLLASAGGLEVVRLSLGGLIEAGRASESSRNDRRRT